jgi:hypothetical protein
MSFHNNVAQRAYASGKTSGQFHAAAQKHANAAWFYLIAAGVVWWLFNWKWALIPLAFTAFVAFQSVSATLIATRLEKLEGLLKSA